MQKKIVKLIKWYKSLSTVKKVIVTVLGCIPIILIGLLWVTVGRGANIEIIPDSLDGKLDEIAKGKKNKSGTDIIPEPHSKNISEKLNGIKKDLG
jgi:hypothetical protein